MFQKQILMLYKFLIALDVEWLMGKVWWVWFLYQISRHGEIPFRSVKINVPTVYLKYNFVFVADLLKTCLPLIAGGVLLYNCYDLGYLGVLHVILEVILWQCFCFVSSIDGQVKDFLKLSIFLHKIRLQHVWPR